MLLNLLITLITCCIRQIENPSHSFNFLPANIAICRVDCARRPLSGAGWLKENHPRFAAVFSFAKPCAKRQSKGRRPIKSGKHIPIGLFILKNLKFKDMKLRLIENICKRTVSLVLLTGICLLYSKGIIPVYLIVLFLLSGTLISLLFRTFTLIVKIIIALTVMGMLV